VLENIPEGTDWVFMNSLNPLLYDQTFMDTLGTVCQERQIAISWFLGEPTQGYVMGYGITIPATDRHAAHVVDRILRGADPAELPVETADNHFWINLEAAEAIGLEIPVGILRQAEVIARPGYFDEPTE
jgi:hypothetical protein